MKIENNPLLPLGQEEIRRKTAQTATDAFNALLNEEMQGATGQSASGLPVTGTGQSAAALALQLQSAQLLQATENTANTGEAEVVNMLDGLLNQWDSYALTLAAPQGDLRSAYGILENMSSELKALKASAPGLTQGNGTLSSLFNELEVLATTETFKFNRGDYL